VEKVKNGQSNRACAETNEFAALFEQLGKPLAAAPLGSGLALLVAQMSTVKYRWQNRV